MGLDPALQEPRGDAEARPFVLAAFILEAREPAREDILAELDAQAAHHTRPSLRLLLTIQGFGNLVLRILAQFLTAQFLTRQHMPSPSPRL